MEGLSVAWIIVEAGTKEREEESTIENRRTSAFSSKGQRGRKIKYEAIAPRSTSRPPPAASIGPTHRNGAREIASMRTPRSPSDNPRVQFCQRRHHWPGL